MGYEALEKIVKHRFFLRANTKYTTSKPGSEMLYAKIAMENSQLGKCIALMQGNPRNGDTSVAMWTNAQECQLQTIGFVHYRIIYFF